MCERTLSSRFSPLSAAARGRRLHAPLPLKRFLECLLTAPLPLVVECRPDRQGQTSDARVATRRNLMIDMARTQRGRSQANQLTNN